MLLRSSSTPILNSWIPHSKETALLEPETIHQKIPRNRSVTLFLPPTPPLVTAEVVSMKKKMLTRTSSQTNLRKMPVAEKNNYDDAAFSLFSVEAVENKVDERLTLDRLFSSSGLLEEGSKVGEGNKSSVNVMVGGGGRIGGGSGGGYGGSGWHGGDGGKSWEWDSNHRNNIMEVYYEQMIEANPGNALLLCNYAKFLKEIRGDYVKSEEYCGRAILANPIDADVLSFYADLIWLSHKDAPRAQSYFDQAVKAAPNNCYVLASYARFIWDTEENEDEQEKLEEKKQETITKKSSPPRFLEDFLHYLPKFLHLS